MDLLLKGALSTLLPGLGTYTAPKNRSKGELIATFRTITTLINLLQPTSLSDDAIFKQDVSQAPRGDQDLRVLIALAVLLVREFDVTAVLSHRNPQIDGTLQVLATRQPQQVPNLPPEVPTSQAPTPPHSFYQYFALRNPRNLDPFVKKADSDGNLIGRGVSFELLTPSTTLNFDVSKPLSGILRAG